MTSTRAAPSPEAGAYETAVLRFAVVVRAYDHPDARRLVHALYDEQVGRYGYADPTEADQSDYAPPAGLFVVGYLDGEPVACGGYRTYDDTSRTVEIKKMYTVPATRGRGYGYAVIRELERRAAAAGARRAILETGVRNTGALALYTGVGYRPVDSYVDGRDPAINRAFAKMLRPS
jgi:GNAT superfamily N-acetyltransferase